MLTSSLALWRQLPTFLRLVWAALLAGLLLLAAGYFHHLRPSAPSAVQFRADTHQSWLGLALILSGYAAATLDALFRRRHRDGAAHFFAGAFLSLILAVFVAALFAACGILVYLWLSFQHGFSAARALHLLHFLGLNYAVLAITGIPNLVRYTSTPPPSSDPLPA